MAAAITLGPYCHCELMSSDLANVAIVQSSSYKPWEKVHVEERTDFERDWDFLYLPDIGPEEENAIMDWCYEQIGKPYSRAKCFLSPLRLEYLAVILCGSHSTLVRSERPGGYAGDEQKSFYCSELVACALKHSGVAWADLIDAKHTNPNSLFKQLSKFGYLDESLRDTATYSAEEDAGGCQSDIGMDFNLE